MTGYDGYMERSDAIWHPVHQERTGERRELTGYEASAGERLRGEAPREQMRMGNSFGQVSLGISDSGKMTFVASKNKRTDETPARDSEEKLHGDRAVSDVRNRVYTNNDGPVASAVAYRQDISRKRDRERMLLRMSGLLEREDQVRAMRGKEDQAETGREDKENSAKVQGEKKQTDDGSMDAAIQQMPFLSLGKDRAELHRLREQQQEAAKDHGNLRAENYGRQIEKLQRRIRMKQEQRRVLMLQLNKALKNGKAINEKENKKTAEMILWHWLLRQSSGADSDDGAAGDAEDSGEEPQQPNQKTHEPDFVEN